ncbi:MAG: DNA cytosine methyltransferase [Planctomycetes bacterium]|nr:DNA cytosine methyltransferase [Planctomycetota bacterium]
MGGLSLAAKQLRMRVLAGVDIAPSATRTYQQNFPRATAITGSVRSDSLIRDCKELIVQERRSYQQAIVVSGPPCQGFSVAGPRDPNDPRNQILLAVARSIVAIQPRCALIENVARILDDDHSARLRKLTSVLANGGYHVNEAVLDAADYGVPQRRKRAFFVITRRVAPAAALCELLELHKQSPVNVAEVLEDLPTPPTRPDKYVDTDDCGGLSNHFAMQHSERVKAKIADIPQGCGPMSYRKLHPEQISNTLISGHRAPPAHYSQPRSITVREAMRLQGFPDDFRVYGSFANQMGQVTNAVPPPLAMVALRVLCEVAGVELE